MNIDSREEVNVTHRFRLYCQYTHRICPYWHTTGLLQDDEVDRRNLRRNFK